MQEIKQYIINKKLSKNWFIIKFKRHNYIFIGTKSGTKNSELF